MKNNHEETSEKNSEETSNEVKYFLKIKSVRPQSKGFNLRLKENDVILCINGEPHNASYEDLKKVLEETSAANTLTILGDEVTFNSKIDGPLGIICENISSDEISNFQEIEFQKIFDKNKYYIQYEIFKNVQRKGIILNLTPSILASMAPPLWMINNRTWFLLAFTLIFHFILFFVSPWLFFVSWVLKSWYYGNHQIDVLRNYYRFKDFRMWLSICAENEEEAQKKARELDEKVDFDYSYLEPPLREDDLADNTQK